MQDNAANREGTVRVLAVNGRNGSSKTQTKAISSRVNNSSSVAPKKKEEKSVRGSSRNALKFQARGMRTVVCPGIGLPDRLCCNLLFTQSVALVGSPASGSQVYRLNSLYDPDKSGVGHQPAQFDQLAALYDQYVVLSCIVEAEMYNSSSTALRAVMVASGVDDSGLDVMSCTEMRYAQETILGPTGGGNALKKWKRTFSMGQLLGHSDLENDPSTYIDTTHDPVEVAWLWFKSQSLDGVSTSSCTVSVRLTYHACFMKRDDPVQS